MDRNKVRDEAMNEVEKRERNKEQFIKRVDKDETHKGYDILSKDRKIEVKGRTGTDRFVQMNDENITAFKDNENFWLYIVHFNKDDKCDQYITLDKNTIENGTHKSKETKRKRPPRKQWEIRFWVDDPNQI